MIIRIVPRGGFNHLDAIIAAQACYYGQRNAHVVFWLYHKLGLGIPKQGIDF